MRLSEAIGAVLPHPQSARVPDGSRWHELRRPQTTSYTYASKVATLILSLRLTLSTLCVHLVRLASRRTSSGNSRSFCARADFFGNRLTWIDLAEPTTR